MAKPRLSIVSPEFTGTVEIETSAGMLTLHFCAEPGTEVRIERSSTGPTEQIVVTPGSKVRLCAERAVLMFSAEDFAARLE